LPPKIEGISLTQRKVQRRKEGVEFKLKAKPLYEEWGEVTFFKLFQSKKSFFIELK